MNQGDTFLAWVLFISTFLIGGKAIGLLNISWTVAFAPLVTLSIISVVIFIIASVIAYKQIKK